jgi:hypothetical protein
MQLLLSVVMRTIDKEESEWEHYHHLLGMPTELFLSTPIFVFVLLLIVLF